MTIFGNTPATILIADDYADNRELLRLLLTRAKYNVQETSSGQECLKMATEQPPDLIMLDLLMPGLDGWEVCRALRSDPRTARIPCVAVTASDSDRKRALESGFNGYILKPFNRPELFETIARLLSSKSEIIQP
jgi:CheY-like chemotaxis protein